MGSLTNFTELYINEAIANPTSVLVTEICYQNGEKSKMITAIPKGITVINIEKGINESLRRQTNVVSFKSQYFTKETSGFSLSLDFNETILTNQNRLPISSEILEYNPTFGVTKSVFA